MSDESPEASARVHEPARPGRGRATAGWLRVVLFAAGVLTGVLVVGLLDVTTPDFARQAGPGPQSPGAAASPVGGGVGAGAQVNAACLAVINDAQDVLAALGDLGPALDAQDLTALDDVVRRLQPVEPRLAEHLRDCRVDTSVGPAGSSATPVVPTTGAPSPTAPLPSATVAPTGTATSTAATPVPAPTTLPARPSTGLTVAPTPR